MGKIKDKRENNILKVWPSTFNGKLIYYIKLLAYKNVCKEKYNAIIINKKSTI